jgi:hypothetical protein
MAQGLLVKQFLSAPTVSVVFEKSFQNSALAGTYSGAKVARHIGCASAHKRCFFDFSGWRRREIGLSTF